MHGSNVQVRLDMVRPSSVQMLVEVLATEEYGGRSDGCPRLHGIRIVARMAKLGRSSSPVSTA